MCIFSTFCAYMSSPEVLLQVYLLQTWGWRLVTLILPLASFFLEQYYLHDSLCELAPWSYTVYLTSGTKTGWYFSAIDSSISIALPSQCSNGIDFVATPLLSILRVSKIQNLQFFYPFLRVYGGIATWASVGLFFIYSLPRLFSLFDFFPVELGLLHPSLVAHHFSHTAFGQANLLLRFQQQKTIFSIGFGQIK